MPGCDKQLRLRCFSAIGCWWHTFHHYWSALCTTITNPVNRPCADWGAAPWPARSWPARCFSLEWVLIYIRRVHHAVSVSRDASNVNELHVRLYAQLLDEAVVNHVVCTAIPNKCTQIRRKVQHYARHAHAQTVFGGLFWLVVRQTCTWTEPCLRVTDTLPSPLGPLGRFAVYSLHAPHTAVKRCSFTTFVYENGRVSSLFLDWTMSDSTRLRLTCTQEGCCKSYLHQSSLSRHVRLDHPDAKKNSEKRITCTQPVFTQVQSGS